MQKILAAIGLLTTTISAAQFGPYEAFAPGIPGWSQLLVLDLDGDTDNDMLGVDPNGFLWWWSNDGAGTFSAAESFTALGVPRVDSWICAADLDGDTDMDLIAMLDPGDYSIEDSTRWFRNEGGMIFQPRPAFVGQWLSILPFAEAVDIDEDGDLDVIAQGVASETCLMKNTDGLGTFTPAIFVTSAVAGIKDIDAGDMDGDGDPDLIATARAIVPFGTFQTIENVDGQGTSWNAALITNNNDEFGCLWIDVDGDLDLDATTTRSSDLSYCLNDGSGNMGAPVVSGIGTGYMRYWSGLDYDGDGDMDIIGATGNHCVWVETVSPGVFVAHTSSDTPMAIGDLAAGDIDGDGDPDVAFVSAAGLGAGWVEHVPGGFGAWHVIQLEPADPVDVAGTDLNGDFAPDAVVAGTANDAIGWYPNADANGTFGAFAAITFTADSVLAIDVADVNGDSHMDVLAAEGRSGELAWYENNNGATIWIEHIFASGLARPNQLQTVDLDHDGDPDVVFTTSTDHLVRYCLNSGGVFGAPQPIGDPVFLPVSLAVADINGDTWADAVVAGQTGSNDDIIWFAALPGGLTFNAGQVALASTTSTWNVSAADLDGDVDQDLVICHTANGKVSWSQNADGLGQFLAPVDLTAALQVHKAVPIDADSDGAMDVIAIRQNYNGAVWMRSLGGGSFSPYAAITSGLYYGTDIASTDMDQDGDPDLLLCGTQNDDVATIENFFGSPFRISGPVFLDLDGDGAYGAGDAFAPFIPVSTTPFVSIPFTGTDGGYTFYLNEGAYAVEAPLVSTCWGLTTDSTAYHEVLTPQDPARTGREFGYGITCDTTIVALTRSSTSMCGSVAAIDLHLFNTGTTMPQGMLRVELDPLAPFVSSTPAPAQQDGDTVWIAIGPLDYFDQSSVRVLVDAPGPDLLGDTLHFAAHFMAENDQGDALGEFSDAWEQRVLCAYDPNDKSVEPAGAGVQGLIPMDTERLIYRVRFQNTGNDTATTVVIHDMLSPQLDRASMHVLGWSHPFTLRIEADGEALFTFDNIMLPDSGADQLGSQGHVIWSIAPWPGSPAGTVIANTASIVFDLNVPVITNTVVNTLFDCGLASATITDMGDGVLMATPGSSYQWALNGVPIPGAVQQEFIATESGSYSVTVTDAIGCAPVSDPYPLVILGTNGMAQARISCFPDPFTSSATVVLPQDPGTGAVLEVIDALGHPVSRSRVNGRTVVLDGHVIGAGVFTLRCLAMEGKTLWSGRIVHLR